MQDVFARNRYLEGRVGELEDELRAFKRQAMLDADEDKIQRLVKHLHLSYTLALSLWCLYAHRSRAYMSKGSLADFMGRNRYSTGAGDTNINEVRIAKLRVRLGKDAITTVHGCGWALSETTIEKIELALECL